MIYLLLYYIIGRLTIDVLYWADSHYNDVLNDADPLTDNFLSLFWPFILAFLIVIITLDRLDKISRTKEY